MATFDAHANFGYSTVLTPPSPAASGTSLALQAGDGALLPAAPFNMTVWPTAALALSTNAEIVRVTGVVGDVLTITRTQEGSSARTIIAGDQIAVTITKKTITDIETVVGVVNISAGTTSQARSNYTFGNAGGVSFGIDTNGLVTAAAGTAAPAPVFVSAGTTDGSLGTINFLDSNGVTWGLNGSTISATVKTAYRNLTDAIGLATAQTNVTWTANSAGLSLNAGGYAGTGFTATTTAGTDVKGTHNTAGLSLAVPAFLTTARGSTDGIGLATAQTNVTWTVNSAGLSVNAGGYAGTGFTSTTTAGTEIKATHNTAGLSMAVPNFLTAAGGVQTAISGIIASDATYTSGSVYFSGQANITIGSSVDGASQYVRLSVGAQSAQSAIKALGVSNVGNTVGDTGVSTGINWVIAGSNNITANQSTTPGGPNTIWLSGAAAAGGGTGSVYATGNQTQNTSGTQDYSSVLYGGRGAISVGFSGGTIQISGPATSSLVGSNGVNLSTSGSTITISGWTLPHFEPYPLFNALSTTFAPGIGSLYFQPFVLPAYMSGGRLNRLTAFGSTASILRESSANFNSNSTGSRSVAFQYSNKVALYSLGAGTQSTRLESAWSSMFSLELRHSVSVNSGAGPQLSVTVGGTMSYIASIDAAGGATTASTTYSGTLTSVSSALATSAISSILSSLRAGLSSQILMPVPLNTAVTPGAYWLAEMWSTASTTAGTSFDVLSVVNRVAIAGNLNTAYRNWGNTVATSGSQVFPGQGVYSAASAAFPATVAFSDVRTAAGQPALYFNIVNSTI